MEVLLNWPIKCVRDRYIPSILSHHPDILYFSLSLSLCSLFSAVFGQTACGVPQALRLQLPNPAFSCSFTFFAFIPNCLAFDPKPSHSFVLVLSFFLAFFSQDLHSILHPSFPDSQFEPLLPFFYPLWRPPMLTP